MATTNKVKGWTGVLMTEDSSSHWPTKRRHVYYETSRRAGLEFVCVFGHDALVQFIVMEPSWISPSRGRPLELSAGRAAFVALSLSPIVSVYSSLSIERAM